MLPLALPCPARPLAAPGVGPVIKMILTVRQLPFPCCPRQAWMPGATSTTSNG